MRKIIASLTLITAVLSIATGATRAYFSDTETSTGNTFSSGTLDLNIDGGDENVVKFNVTGMKPGSQNIGTWRFKNVGSINGYLDLQNISVSNEENECTEAEVEAGDESCEDEGDGELQDLVSLSKLFWDTNCDGWVGTGETTVYDGKAGAIASDYDTNKTLNAGAEVCLTGQFNWWSSEDDNLGQGDSFTLDLTAELGQTTAQ